MFGLFNKSEKHVLNNPVSVEFQYGDETVRLETGRFAKQATGSVMATMGGTMVLATVCAEKTAVEGQDFFPLTVDYQEKYASSGRIPGSRDRREGKASVSETLVARLIDRPIRPLFPETFKNKVQIIAQVFVYDCIQCGVGFIRCSICGSDWCGSCWIQRRSIFIKPIKERNRRF